MLTDPQKILVLQLRIYRNLQKLVISTAKLFISALHTVFISWAIGRYRLCKEVLVVGIAFRDSLLSAQRQKVAKFTQQQPMALEQEVENWQDLQEKQGTTVAGLISSFRKPLVHMRGRKKPIKE